jgi:hypothetical protein
MQQLKIALSLAIIGALASPFMAGSYKVHPTVDEWVQLEPAQKTKITAYMEETKNCQTLADRVPKSQTRDLLSNSDYLRGFSCRNDLEKLVKGGESESHVSALKYIATNLAVALCGFLVVFGLTLLIPSIARRYWNWLKA